MMARFKERVKRPFVLALKLLFHDGFLNPALIVVRLNGTKIYKKIKIIGDGQIKINHHHNYYFVERRIMRETAALALLVLLFIAEVEANIVCTI